MLQIARSKVWMVWIRGYAQQIETYVNGGKK